MDLDYDANGNMDERDVTYPNAGGTDEWWDFAYDEDDRLVEVSHGDTTVAEYGYDPFGRRALKSVDGVDTVFFYDREDVVQELKGDSVTSWIHGPGIDDYVGAKIWNGYVGYAHTDGLGSVTQMRMRINGALVQRSEYAPFGEKTLLNDPYGVGDWGYGYTGRRMDGESGLMYYRSRYYSPELRRFVQEDRWGGILHKPSAYINKYAYVENNPINLVDPSGKLVCEMACHTVCHLAFLYLHATPPSFAVITIICAIICHKACKQSFPDCPPPKEGEPGGPGDSPLGPPSPCPKKE